MGSLDTKSRSDKKYPFLSGGGEMGALIRNYRWSSSPIGAPDEWPLSLRTTLGIVLHSAFPMFLFWGKELTCFYNDAFRPSLGNDGKHPCIGKKGKEIWPEIWDFIGPLIDKVMTTGEAVRFEDQLVPFFRNGRIENIYWTFCYSPVYDESGTAAGVLVTCTETTDKINTLKKLEENERRLKQTILQAPVAIAIFRGSDYVVEIVNERALELWGRKEEDVINKPIFKAMPELLEQGIKGLLDAVYHTGVPFSATELPVKIIRKKKVETVYVNFVYEPVYDIDGTVNGIMTVGTDVSAHVIARKQTEDNEEKLNIVIDASELGTWELDLKTGVIKYSDKFIEILGHKAKRNITHKEILKQLYEDDIQKRNAAFEHGYRTGFLEYKLRIHWNNGSIHWIETKGKVFYDDKKLPEKIIGTVKDITEEVSANQLLKESTERLTLATEGTLLSTWDLNLQTFDIIYSPGLPVLFGHPKGASVKHAAMRQQIHPEDLKPIVEKAFDSALKTGIYSYEARVIHPDKTIRWIRTNGKIIFSDAGVPIRMLGTMIDITDNKIAEINIAQMAAIVHSSDDAIISKNLDGIIATWNTAAERIFGYTADEMIGQPMLKLFPEDRVDEELMILEQLKNGNRVDHFETKRVTKNRKILDVSLTISPIKDSNGKIIGASKIARDITKQKETERLIKESEEKFRMLADTMPQLVWTTDAAGNINYYSRAVFDYSGLTAEQIGKDPWILIHPDDREENSKAWINSVTTGTDFIFEHRFRRADGEYRWQLSRAIPQRNADGVIQMWVGSSTDIQEMKELDQQKDYFISMASHELKTPITSIKGYIQILRSMYSTSEDNFLKNSLGIIDKQILALTKLITDLLDLSKIKSGSLLLNKEKFQVNELINEVIDEMKHVNPDYTIGFSEQDETAVYADRERIGQVLINFLTNAVKYSPYSHSIQVTSITTHDNILVSVADSGIGINKNDQQKIFERFYRVEGKDEKTFPGFGIGLFIAAEIIRRHNGKIGVTSEPGKGSVFYFSLPLNNESKI